MSEPDRKDKRPDPEHEHELTVLEAMVKQEDTGWGGTWTKERYQSLKEKHPTAYKAYLARLKVQKARKQHERDLREVQLLFLH